MESLIQFKTTKETPTVFATNGSPGSFLTFLVERFRDHLLGSGWSARGERALVWAGGRWLNLTLVSALQSTYSRAVTEEDEDYGSCNGSRGGAECRVHLTRVPHGPCYAEAEEAIRQALKELTEAREEYMSAEEWIGDPSEALDRNLGKEAAEVINWELYAANWRAGPRRKGLLSAKFIPEYLHYVRRFGLLTHKIARLCRTTPTKVKRFIAEHPLGKDFERAVAAAEEEYRQNVLHSLVSRAVDGYPEPIFNKNGQQIGERRRFPEAMAVRILEKMDPSYQQKSQMDVNMKKTTGVLVVQSAANTVEEWRRLASTAQTQPKERK